jgi:precorrin-3B C17-methyltransferase
MKAAMTPAMSGRLVVIGLGPGDAGYLTPQAADALAAADALYGYGPYLDRVPVRPGQSRHPSDNREEGARAAAALRHAAQGTSVAVVSGGDPGVFAMAAAICEQIESGPDAWRALEIEFVPGITAMLAVAARIGAPLGHDFCALSLSDNGTSSSVASMPQRTPALSSHSTIRYRGRDRGSSARRWSACAGICPKQRPWCSAAPLGDPTSG